MFLDLQRNYIVNRRKKIWDTYQNLDSGYMNMQWPKKRIIEKNTHPDNSWSQNGTRQTN